jgi:hypothetical protein
VVFVYGYKMALSRQNTLAFCLAAMLSIHVNFSTKNCFLKQLRRS